MSNKGKCTIAVTTIVLLLLIDQIIKVWVKLNMNIGEEIVVFNWFRISFIENRGMAFGMEIGSKLFLSLFRIVAVGALTWYIYKRIKEGARTGYIIVLSMIYAGAAGNILDSLFYGEIFTASHPYYTNLPPAHLVPWGEGYASVLMGVDPKPLFDAVHEANMGKVFPDGKARQRRTGLNLIHYMFSDDLWLYEKP